MGPNCRFSLGLGSPVEVGCGVAFKLTADGAFTSLYHFDDAGGGGYFPTSLLSDGHGNLLGTATDVLFKLDFARSRYTIVRTFRGTSPNTIIIDGHGNLFGFAGEEEPPPFVGVVFRLGADGRYAVLHRFAEVNDVSSPDGYGPNALVIDNRGNLYGTTEDGGTFSRGNCETGCGVLFRLTPGGSYTILHSFTNGADGATPRGGLVVDDAGNLYGTAADGGAQGTAGGSGVVFKVTPDGAFTIVHDFGAADGFQPTKLVRDRQGNLFGAADGHNGPVLFRLTPDGTYTILYGFDGPNSVIDALSIDGGGTLYGAVGGQLANGTDGYGYGVVFKFVPST